METGIKPLEYRIYVSRKKRGSAGNNLMGMDTMKAASLETVLADDEYSDRNIQEKMKNGEAVVRQLH